jgi:hypothetical protein
MILSFVAFPQRRKPGFQSGQSACGKGGSFRITQLRYGKGRNPEGSTLRFRLTLAAGRFSPVGGVLGEIHKQKNNTNQEKITLNV